MTAPSPFAVLEDTFGLLSTGPHPLGVDGRRLGGGVPCRQVPIAELRAIVTRPTASSDLQQRVIEAVLDCMAQQPATWVVVLGGLLLPALRCLADRMTASGDQRLGIEVEAELLARLLMATRRPPRDTHRFAMHLLGLAQASAAQKRHAARPVDRQR
jgi:hypothetical protein